MSTGHFWYTLLPSDTLSSTMQHMVKVIAVRATCGLLETLTAAMRYKTTRAISSSPVQ